MANAQVCILEAAPELFELVVSFWQELDDKHRVRVRLTTSVMGAESLTKSQSPDPWIIEDDEGLRKIIHEVNTLLCSMAVWPEQRAEFMAFFATEMGLYQATRMKETPDAPGQAPAKTSAWVRIDGLPVRTIYHRESGFWRKLDNSRHQQVRLGDDGPIPIGQPMTFDLDEKVVVVITANVE